MDRPRVIARVVAVSGVLLLTGHFVATAVYINPIAVVGLAWHAPIAEYLEPLFRQRWSLFAPDPPMLDRRLDYQCEIDGTWLSRSEQLMATHARWRLGPAASLHRLESAAIVASVGAQDPILDELLATADQASPEQRERIDRLLAERVATSIVTSETAYRLILAYCDEELGRRPDRMRYRIVTSDVVPYSQRNSPTTDTRPRAMTMPWLGSNEIDSLELRARQYLDTYEQQKLAGEPGQRADG